MIIDELREELRLHDKPENRVNYQQFFKEKLKEPTGLRGPVLRKISDKRFKEINGKSKDKILDICDELLKAGDRYFRFFAFDWASKLADKYQKKDFFRFEAWLKKCVDNWGSCDHLCSGPIGRIILRFPVLAKKTVPWTRSKNRWLRRAAAVSLIVSVRNGKLLDEVFKTADKLLTDNDDMVQKGYGWMLKDASLTFPDEVFEYVMDHKAKMPRTALRYAIERYPKEQRQEAMQK